MTEAAWYVYAQDRAWGPYTEPRMRAFVEEGRVTAGALIAPTPDGPFLPAGEDAVFSHLFDIAPIQPIQTFPEPAPVAPRTFAAPVEHAGAARPLLVFAILGALHGTAFEAALAIHGPFERVAQGLWLTRARLAPAALRNALSRRLRGEGALLVVEASLDHVAWFNLDQAEERKLRTLWLG